MISRVLVAVLIGVAFSWQNHKILTRYTKNRQQETACHIWKRFFSSSKADGLSTEGHVERLASRQYHPDHSKPSSKGYTTRKVEQKKLVVTKHGVQGDYNHYRSVALQNTTDRAVSILTSDVMELIRSSKYDMSDGDLGENILVSGVPFDFFEPHQMYTFTSPSLDEKKHVIIEITGKMDPCANLCKLPCINDDSKPLHECVKNCQDLLALLDQKPGLRGWYAKVLQQGLIESESKVVRIK